MLRLSHLGPDARRAYVLADNKLAENAGWDRDILAIELQALIDTARAAATLCSTRSAARAAP